MNMLMLQQSRKRSRDMEQSSLPVLRRPSRDDRFLLASLPKLDEARRAQELFLSVVMEWQRTADSDGYTTPSSEDFSDVEAQSPALQKSKRVHDVSPTSVEHNPPRDLSPLRLDYKEPAKMIGAYTPAARRVLLQKYMAKRARRLSQHKVRYGVRKTLANARPRVKGRFVKTVQPLTAAAVEAKQAQQQQQHQQQ